MPPVTRSNYYQAHDKTGETDGNCMGSCRLLVSIEINAWPWSHNKETDPMASRKVFEQLGFFVRRWAPCSRRSSFRSFLWISFPNKELQMCIKFHSHFFQRMLPHLRAMNPKLTARSRFGLPGCHWMVPGSESVLGSQMGKVITMGFHRMKSWSWKVHYKLVKDQFVDSSNDLWEKES